MNNSQSNIKYDCAEKRSLAFTPLPAGIWQIFNARCMIMQLCWMS